MIETEIAVKLDREERCNRIKTKTAIHFDGDRNRGRDSGST
jgi:hypothetical protein